MSTRTEQMQDAMNRLRQNIGKVVHLKAISYGSVHEDDIQMQSVEDFVGVGFETQWVPFVGYGCGIMEISLDGETLYVNDSIPATYDGRSDEEMYNMLSLSFGQEVADNWKTKKEEAEKVRQAELEESAKIAKEDKMYLIEGGKLLVKDGLYDEWSAYADKNTNDGYSAEVIRATVAVLQALSDGKTCEEAEKVMHQFDLTGFMAGAVSSGVAHFHERGDEYKDYWNKQWGVEEGAKGVVNPAILTVGDKQEE